jgi:hypothetical protein
MRSSQTVRLRTGLLVDGVWHTEAAIAPPTGVNEEAIGEAARWPSPAARVSALLASTVTRIGSIAPVSLEHVRSLTVPDRDLLLRALYQAMFGDRIESTIRCLNTECEKPIDLDFNLSDLAIPEQREVLPFCEVEIGGRTCVLRPVNGNDQESVAELACTHLEHAERELLERCIVPSEGGPPASELMAQVSSDQIRTLQAEMASHSPQLETLLGGRCPECGVEFVVCFDIQDFILQRISQASFQLYRQVHTLAWYYHWSESEILAMPPDKRSKYLDLLSETLTEAEGMPA